MKSPRSLLSPHWHASFLVDGLVVTGLGPGCGYLRPGIAVAVSSRVGSLCSDSVCTRWLLLLQSATPGEPLGFPSGKLDACRHAHDSGVVSNIGDHQAVGSNHNVIADFHRPHNLAPCAEIDVIAHTSHPGVDQGSHAQCTVGANFHRRSKNCTWGMNDQAGTDLSIG